MLQESSRPVTAHKLEMQNRNHVDLTGITEVISFDNKEIELETVEGAVRFAVVVLNELRLTLEMGVVDFDVIFCFIVYLVSTMQMTAGGVLSRLFG